MSTSKNEQWGNIQLPGLSDEELLKRNWNRVTAAREVHQRESWHQAQEEAGHRFQKGINNAIERMGGYDTWYQQHCASMAKLGQQRRESDEYKNNIGPKISAHWQDDDEYQKHCQALREGWNKPGARENKSRSVNEVLSRPGMLEAHQERARKNGRKTMRPCQSPEGIFESNRAWAEKTGYSRDLFGYRARKMPDQYYYITQEEYTRLTGKKI